MSRLGYTLPLGGIGLDRQAAVVREAESLGYSDAWSSEVDALDAFTPLAMAAMATDSTRLGTAIVSAFTRGPITLAMSAAGIAELAPGRFCLGLGASSNVVVEKWNDVAFERPLSRVRDMTEILRAAFAGERVSMQLDTLSVDGLRLSRPPAQPIPIFLAALRSRMLRLAGEAADGVLLNWLGAGDVATVVEQVRAGEAAARERGSEPVATEVAARVFVAPGDPAAAEVAARRAIAAYMTVPVYWKFQQWLGRGDALGAMALAWADGDRKGATAAIPDEVIEQLIVTGDAATCRERVAAYHRAGVDTVILEWLPVTRDPAQQSELVLASLRELAPNA